jgi:hypothetical protein
MSTIIPPTHEQLTHQLYAALSDIPDVIAMIRNNDDAHRDDVYALVSYRYMDTLHAAIWDAHGYSYADWDAFCAYYDDTVKRNLFAALWRAYHTDSPTVFHITLSNGSTLRGAIQGYGGECATLERAREYVERLQRSSTHRTVYIKRDFDPITGIHTRVDVDAMDIVEIRDVWIMKTCTCKCPHPMTKQDGSYAYCMICEGKIEEAEIE